MAATITQEEKNAITLDGIRISQHAIDRFMERVGKLNGGTPTTPEETIRKLLAKAKPENIDPVHRVKRLIKHGDCEFYENSGWRFVISDGALLTVERRKTGQN